MTPRARRAAGTVATATPTDRTVPTWALRERRLAAHIISASATLVGVCLTVTGALWIVGRLQGLKTIADGLLTVDALASTAACAFAYASLRTPHETRAWWYERIADYAFLLALVLMTTVCGMIAYEIL